MANLSAGLDQKWVSGAAKWMWIILLLAAVSAVSSNPASKRSESDYFIGKEE